MAITIARRIALAKRIRDIRSHATALSRQLDVFAKEIATIEETDGRSEIIQSVSDGLGISPSEFSTDVLNGRVLKLRVHSKKLAIDPSALPFGNTSNHAVRVSAHPIIQKLRTMQVAEILGSWRNAINTLADPAKSASHPEAQLLLEAIDAEWIARRQKVSSDGYFKWPSAEPGHEEWEEATARWMDVGPLAFMGYHAGKTADLATPHRQGILSRVFTGEIPPVFPKAYLDAWGRPGTALRLRKMATAIAFSLRSKLSSNDPRMFEAIADWTADLSFLHDAYYVGKFGFAWPSASEPGPQRPPKRPIAAKAASKTSTSKSKGKQRKAPPEPMRQLSAAEVSRNLALLRAAKPSLGGSKRKKK